MVKVRKDGLLFWRVNEEGDEIIKNLKTRTGAEIREVDW